MQPTSPGLAGATAGIGALSSIFVGLGQRQAGKQEQAGFDYNADVAQLNAGEEMVATEQRYSQLVGRQATAYAASGVDITKGSPLLMMAATAGRGGRQQAQELQRGNEEVHTCNATTANWQRSGAPWAVSAPCSTASVVAHWHTSKPQATRVEHHRERLTQANWGRV